MFFTAALAALASAVVFIWLFNPLSMLGAATREEYAALGQRSDRKPARTQPEGPGWDDVIAAANAEYRSSPARGPQGAVSRLLHLVREVELGYRIAPDALPDAQAEAEMDRDNLVVRLAVATLVDLSNAPASPPGEASPTAMNRYEAVRAVVEEGGPAGTATLHNAELTKTWYGVLKRFIKRPQVAASLAVSFPHDCIEIHYEVLPVIQERLTGLADELRKAGRPDEAEDCTRWLAQLAVGLMKTDTDLGTRLLCADLLARSLRNRPAIAEPLARMRPDFHAAAAAAPIDLCDQSFSQFPSVAPSAYRKAFDSLVLVGASAAMGAGAAVVFVFSCIAACIARVFRRADPPPDSKIERRRMVRIIFSLAPSLVLGSLLIAWFEEYGLFSELWGYVVAASLVAGGAIWTVVSAGWITAGRGRGRSGVGPPWPTGTRENLRPAALGLLVVLPILLPPPIVAWLAREIELRVSIVWVLVPWLCVLAVAAALCSPAKWRTVAAAAAMAWCVNMAAAVLILPYHQIADNRYQKAVASARFDEVAARLGADWEAKYLKPTIDAFALDKP